MTTRKKRGSKRVMRRFYSFNTLTISKLKELAEKRWVARRSETLLVTALYDGGLIPSKEALLRGISMRGVTESGSGCWLSHKRTRDYEWETKSVVKALSLIDILQEIRGIRIRVVRCSWINRKRKRAEEVKI